jgi:hypothetical protein
LPKGGSGKKHYRLLILKGIEGLFYFGVEKIMKKLRKIFTGCLWIFAVAAMFGIGILFFLFQGFLIFLYRLIFG